MARTFRPVMSIHHFDDRALEYFELPEPISTIRSHCRCLNGGAGTAIFSVEPCHNSVELVMAIQGVALRQERMGVFGSSHPGDVHIFKVTVNKVSATAWVG